MRFFKMLTRRKRKHPQEAGYVVARAVGYGLIWLGWLLFAASFVALTLARYL